MAVQVADRISDETGKEIEVLDLRSLSPLDKEAIMETVKKTSRVLIVHEDKVFAGFGGELASMIAEEAFEFLDAPVKRVGSTFTPVGFNRILEKEILPNAEKNLRCRQIYPGFLRKIKTCIINAHENREAFFYDLNI